MVLKKSVYYGLGPLLDRNGNEVMCTRSQAEKRAAAIARRMKPYGYWKPSIIERDEYYRISMGH